MKQLTGYLNNYVNCGTSIKGTLFIAEAEYSHTVIDINRTEFHVSGIHV